MRQWIVIGCLSVQTACTTPDVSKELAAANTLATQTGESLQERLAPIAKAELKAAEEALIRDGGTVIAIEGSCDIAAARGAGLARADCMLLNWADPGAGPVNATAALEAINVVQAYFAALKDLYETSAPSDIATRTDALLAALAQAGSGQSMTLQRLAAEAAEHKPVLVKTVGFAAEQYRTSQLRRVVRKADPLLHDLTRTASAYLDTDLDPTLAKAQTALADAREKMLDAQFSGDAARYRQAIADLRTAFDNFKTAEANASAAGLLTLRQLHASLLARLTGGGSPAEIQATLNTLFDIIELAKK